MGINDVNLTEHIVGNLYDCLTRRVGVAVLIEISRSSFSLSNTRLYVVIQNTIHHTWKQ